MQNAFNFKVKLNTIHKHSGHVKLTNKVKVSLFLSKKKWGIKISKSEMLKKGKKKQSEEKDFALKFFTSRKGKKKQSEEKDFARGQKGNNRGYPTLWYLRLRSRCSQIAVPEILDDIFIGTTKVINLQFLLRESTNLLHSKAFEQVNATSFYPRKKESFRGTTYIDVAENAHPGAASKYKGQGSKGIKNEQLARFFKFSSPDVPNSNEKTSYIFRGHCEEETSMFKFPGGHAGTLRGHAEKKKKQESGEERNGCKQKASMRCNHFWRNKRRKCVKILISKCIVRFIPKCQHPVAFFPEKSSFQKSRLADLSCNRFYTFYNYTNIAEYRTTLTDESRYSEENTDEFLEKLIRSDHFGSSRSEEVIHCSEFLPVVEELSLAACPIETKLGTLLSCGSCRSVEDQTALPTLPTEHLGDRDLRSPRQNQPSPVPTGAFEAHRDRLPATETQKHLKSINALLRSYDKNRKRERCDDAV
ncbi:hypothetical protein WN51_10996 [Melipona quadrifasciata]|uniref:Uncharacterized protein n=1 Tax=Melipona quadrifasciata TaxID=166423 RepID=A0A0M9A5D1_9HYME|nr:hypothetical protein WN51_10996 [Melipona quadrifasciata]